MCLFVVCGSLDSSAVNPLHSADVLIIKMPITRTKQQIHAWQYTQDHRNHQLELYECIVHSVNVFTVSVKLLMLNTWENKTVQCVLTCVPIVAAFTFQGKKVASHTWHLLLMSASGQKEKHFKSFSIRIWATVIYGPTYSMWVVAIWPQSLICFIASDTSGAKKAVFSLKIRIEH